MTRERDDEPRKAVHPTSQPGPTPDDVNDDPTEAGRLLDERLIKQAQRDALTAAAEDLDTLLRLAATVPDWLRKRAERL